MRKTAGVLFGAAIATVIAMPAYGHTRHRHHYRHYAHYRHHHTVVAHNFAEGLGHGLIHMLDSIKTVDTVAGPIRVAAAYADRFIDLIADFAEAGYVPSQVHCFARGGHVRHSKHYLGQACDFNQTGWGKTDHFMYTHEAAAIIRRHGFTNGCSFRDCGHVGTDGQGTRYAKKERRRRQHYAGAG